VGPPQRLMIRSLLRQIDFLEGEVTQLRVEVANPLHDHEDAIERLDTISGVGRRVAEEILAEIGTDRGGFPLRPTSPPGRRCVQGTPRAPTASCPSG
jgi:hypothetical protein